jgi:iron complex outermembrane receptor protein
MFGPGPAIAPTAVNLSPSFQSWTPKFGIDWKPTQDILVYASASRGFKAGGFNGLAVANPLVFSSVYQPQTVWAYEVGVKLSAFDNRATANLSVFRNELKALQQTVQIAAGSFAVQNVGDARLDGVELELSARPLDGLDLFANLALNDDSYGALNPQSDAARFGAKRLPLTSRWSYAVGGSYDTPTFAGDRVKLRLAANYADRGSYFSVVNNLLRTEGYGLLDASIALVAADDRWSLQVGARNLTDELYYTTAATADAIAVGEPRTFSVILRSKF